MTVDRTRPAAADSEPLMVRLRLIGQMEAWTLTSESILPTGRKTRALLAILALTAPRPVLRGKLAEMLWSRRPEEQARASLRQEIHRLLDALGPVGTRILAIHRDHLMLRPGTVWVDVEEVLRANPGKPAALCLLDGDLLEDLDGVDPAFDNWLAAERERLRDRARVLAEQMLRDQADPELAIPAAQQLLSIDRAHEGAWRALMRAYAGRGERGMALQAYERCRAVLADLLDAPPSEETQRLASDIRATVNPQRPGPAPSSAPPVNRDPRGLVRPASASIEAVADHGPAQEIRALPQAAVTGAANGGAHGGTNGAAHQEITQASRSGARLGVLPMQVASGDPADRGLAASLAEEITACLARFRPLSLISSAALARLAATARDEAVIGRAYSLDFLLDGTLQRAGATVRVSLRLLDLRQGAQIVWAERFDRDDENNLALQDEIAAAVAARIDPALMLIEAQRSSQLQAGELTAQEAMMRAVALMTRLDQGPYRQAGLLLEQALAQEPDQAELHSWQALWQLCMLAQGWATDRASASMAALQHAERAVMLDGQDPRALTVAGHVRAVLQHRLTEGAMLHERALTLNPNLALAWSLSALAQLYAGNPEEATRRANRARLLAPIDPHGFFRDTALIAAALLQHDHARAVSIGREASEMHPGWIEQAVCFVAALGHAHTEAAAPRHVLTQQADEVALCRQRLLARSPGLTRRQLATSHPYQRDGDWAHIDEGLRRAGLPE